MFSILKSSFLASGFLLLSHFPAQAQFEQSPIDLSADEAIFTESISLSEQDFDYGNNITLNFIDVGLPDLQASVNANPDTPNNTFTFNGELYNLLQFHFHRPSEHLLNGQEFPLELHLVHQNTEGELLVIGRFMEEGNFNPLLDQIFSNLPENGEPPVSINNFDLSALLPSSLDSFQYEGSLTTFPFTEGVQWIVLNEVLEVSSSQIADFQALFPVENARDTQPLNDRIVLTDVQNVATVPEPTTVLGLLAFGGVGLLISKKKR